MLRAVLDANVFVSAAMSPSSPPGRILEHFLAHRAFELVVSPGMVAEVQRALGYPRVRRRIAPGLDPEEWLLDVVALAEIVADSDAAGGVSRDPDDDRYVSAALAGGAGFVVSGDEDLLAVGGYEGILVVSPRVFVELLGR
ncbi:MAG: putative toxin-antitoxin system toxin component, PIN family [Deltaproteobacteria bacterium]|nr:putative toxin-antitoxin system toxin component, PIN family [Deltaproteobacteria bacterium]